MLCSVGISWPVTAPLPSWLFTRLVGITSDRLWCLGPARKPRWKIDQVSKDWATLLDTPSYCTTCSPLQNPYCMHMRVCVNVHVSVCVCMCVYWGYAIRHTGLHLTQLFSNIWVAPGILCGGIAGFILLRLFGTNAWLSIPVPKLNSIITLMEF